MLRSDTPELKTLPVSIRKHASRVLVGIIIACASVLYVGLNIWVFRFASRTKPKREDFAQAILQKTNIIPATPTPFPIPTPRYMAPGKQTYRISGGKPNAPKIRTLTLDPIDPKPGEKQKISIEAYDKTPIVSLLYTLMTDHKERAIEVKLASGSAENGTWTGEWTADDTYNFIYRSKIELKGQLDTQVTEPMYR